jgi:hypothetical protein
MSQQRQEPTGRRAPSDTLPGATIAPLVALLCAIAGAGLLVFVVCSSTPAVAAAAVVGCLLIAVASTEVG